MVVIACMSIAGNAILSMLVYKSIRSSEAYRDEFPPGSIVEMTAN
jgi:hypothetical protein